MVREIHKYFSITECPKCGVARVYYNDKNFDLTFYAPQRWNEDIHVEIVLVKCQNCSFRWIEHPKDHVEPQKIVQLEKCELTPEQKADKEIEELNLTSLETEPNKIEQRRSVLKVVAKIITVLGFFGSLFALFQLAN